MSDESPVATTNIQTVSKERLSDFITSCTALEMEKIDKALLVSLGSTSPII